MLSEVYLTKVERKTIFTQGLIYVLLMFVIADVMVVGPLWFKLFPWIYFLGLIAKSRFSKPVLALVIASFTTFISAILKTGGLTLEVMIVTLNSIFMVTAGVITGTYIFDLKLSHRLVKFIPKAKKVYMVIICCIITFVIMVINSYINGNAVNYITSKNEIHEYIYEQYGEKEFAISDTKYELVNFEPQYTYNVKIQNEDVTIVFNKNKRFEDISYMSRLEKKNREFRTNIKGDMDIFNNNQYIKEYNISFELEYLEKFLNPYKLNIYIEKIQTEDKKEDVFKEIIDVVQKISEMEKVKEYECEYIVTYGENVTNITRDNIDKLTIKYLRDSFVVESIS